MTSLCLPLKSLFPEMYFLQLFLIFRIFPPMVHLLERNLLKSDCQFYKVKCFNISLLITCSSFLCTHKNIYLMNTCEIKWLG